jgi:DNA-binding MarR family transcriptional regulator
MSQNRTLGSHPAKTPRGKKAALRGTTAAASGGGAAKGRQPRRAANVPDFRIGFLVHDVSRMRRTLFDQAVRPLGITRSQWWVMTNLSRHEEEGMIQTDLARVLDVGKVTIGGLIDRLEASGHVERRPDPEDRRVKRIFITEQGHEVMLQLMSVGGELNKIILKGIDPKHIEIAEEVLHQMKDNIRTGLDPATQEPAD